MKVSLCAHGGTEIIGYLNEEQTCLYDKSGGVLASFDNDRKYLYTPNGNVYGHLDDQQKYLCEAGVGIVGYFSEPLRPGNPSR